jgi:hypothetical protein
VRKQVGRVELLQVRIGTRSLDGSRTNEGMTLFSLGVAHPPAQQPGGSVIAYYGGARWLGRATAFTGDTEGGTFDAQGVGRSHGRASGRFHC